MTSILRFATNNTRDFGIILSLVVGSFIALFCPEAFAQTAGGLGKIVTKAEEIRAVTRAVAIVIVAIGAIWVGLKFIKGDQDAWSYAWKFGLGGVIVFSSGEIVGWLQN
jgi:hypothetical protein